MLYKVSDLKDICCTAYLLLVRKGAAEERFLISFSFKQAGLFRMKHKAQLPVLCSIAAMFCENHCKYSLPLWPTQRWDLHSKNVSSSYTFAQFTKLLPKHDIHFWDVTWIRPQAYMIHMCAENLAKLNTFYFFYIVRNVVRAQYGSSRRIVGSFGIELHQTFLEEQRDFRAAWPSARFPGRRRHLLRQKAVSQSNFSFSSRQDDSLLNWKRYVWRN